MLQLERTIGSSGTSIGTHLMLESLFGDTLTLYDKEREFKKVNPNLYSVHVYNLYTVVRNILHSVTDIQNRTKLLTNKSFVKLLKLELSNIAKLYKKTTCRPALFYPDYTNVYKGYNLGKDTAITKVYEEHLNIKSILNKVSNSDTIESINSGKGYKLPTLEGKILLTTNIAVDLFNHNRNIDLIESNTGVVKSKYSFNSKYHTVGKNDLSNLPFIEEIYYILGDKTIVIPTKLSTRRELLELAIKKNWTPMTTRDKVLNDIKTNICLLYTSDAATIA